MKIIRLMGGCLGLLGVMSEPWAQATEPAAANPFGTWAYMGAMPTLSKAPYVRGKLVRAAWADLEPKPGVWQWDVPQGGAGHRGRVQLASPGEVESTLGLDSELKAAAAANLQIILVVFSGSHSPDWIYGRGVPQVKTTGTEGVQSDVYPYYLNATYQSLFQNMIVQVRRHIDTLPPEVRSHLLGLQAGFSSTGDYGPYHGTLVDSRYEISEAKWMEYYQQMSLFYYQQYEAAQSRIRLLFNPSNDPDRADTLIEWLKVHCPHSIIKAGNIGHMYQINGERDQIRMLRTKLFTREQGDYLRVRSEFGEDSKTGRWREAPAWNMYSLLQAALYTGLDLDCFERGDELLTDPSYFPAFEFFNRYAGLKDPATAPGAWCGLRDGLDAADTRRFPVDQFGPAELKNRERYLKIAAAFAAQGARQEDPAGGLVSGIGNRKLKAPNDVGWQIYTGNYESFLTQIDPAATSVGYWRIGPKDQPYGRYGRGFSHAQGKDALSFRFDRRFLTLGADTRLDVRVVYFDHGHGSWKLCYAGADGTLRSAAAVQKQGTERWQETTVPLRDAHFGAGEPNGCDLRLLNTGADDTVFELVEARRVP